jgi:hypothetical protein
MLLLSFYIENAAAAKARLFCIFLAASFFYLVFFRSPGAEAQQLLKAN